MSFRPCTAESGAAERASNTSCERERKDHSAPGHCGRNLRSHSLALGADVEKELEVAPPAEVPAVLPLSAVLLGPSRIVGIVVTLNRRLAPADLKDVPAGHDADGDAERDGEDESQGEGDPGRVVRPLSSKG